MDALTDGEIAAGDVVVIRYEGPKGGPGMREMLAITGAIKGAGLGKDVLLLTDGRFSGGTTGLCVGPHRPRGGRRRPDRVRPRRRPDHPRRRQPPPRRRDRRRRRPGRPARRAGSRSRRSTPAASSASTPRSCSPPRTARSPAERPGGDRAATARLSRALVAVGPHAGAHRVALRAGVSVLVPLVVLAVARPPGVVDLRGVRRGHLALRPHPRRDLAAADAAHARRAADPGHGRRAWWSGLSEHRAWLAVPLAAALAAGGSLLSDVQDWHPRGPLFLVFAFTACASLESRPRDVLARSSSPGSRRRSRCSSAPPAPVLAARAGTRPRPPAAGPHGVRRPVALARRPQRDRRAPRRERGATAAGIGHPYWAMVSAVVPLGSPDFAQQVVRGAAPGRGHGGRARRHRRALRDRPAWGGADRRDRGAPGAGRAAGRPQLRAGPGGDHAAGAADGAPRRAGAGRACCCWDRGVETVIGVLVGVVVGYVTRPARLVWPAGAAPDGRRQHEGRRAGARRPGCVTGVVRPGSGQRPRPSWPRIRFSRLVSWPRRPPRPPSSSPATLQSRLPSRLPGPGWASMLSTTRLRWILRPSRFRSSGPSTRCRISQVAAAAAARRRGRCGSARRSST